MNDDIFGLLRQFAGTASQEAFRILMERYGGLVYAACLRMLDGNEAEAKDAMQAVFIILAKKARGISSRVALGGWLYRTAQMVVSNMRREAARRIKREAEAMRDAEHIGKENSNVLLEEVRPYLDAAMAGLGRKQQDAIVCRFLEGQSIKETAISIGCSEETAKKRIMYGLKNLREFLVRRKVVISTSVLAELLHAEAARAVSEELIRACLASVTGSFAGGAGILAGPGLVAQNVMTIMKIKTAAAVGLAALAAIGTVLLAAPAIQKAIGRCAASSVLADALAWKNAQHSGRAAASQSGNAPGKDGLAEKASQKSAEKGKFSINWEARLLRVLSIKNWSERYLPIACGRSSQRSITHNIREVGRERSVGSGLSRSAVDEGRKMVLWSIGSGYQSMGEERRCIGGSMGSAIVGEQRSREYIAALGRPLVN